MITGTAPPSADQAAPVMYEARSEHRNATTAAISSSVPRRPTGTEPAQPQSTLGTLTWLKVQRQESGLGPGAHLAHELFDDRFPPRAERPLAESAAEPFHAGDADAMHLCRVAVEHDDARVGEDLAHLMLLGRL